VPVLIPSDAVGVLASPEEVLSTLSADGRRRWMYPEESRGRFWRRRLVLGWALIGLFVALPIVRVGGRPAVLLDVVGREFALFGLTLYPTDTLLLLLFGIGSLAAIFLLTALVGRVWCGWACPQTVYLEFVYRPIERLIEGRENVRRRRDAGPWTAARAARKMAKLAAFGLVSIAVAHVFVSYFAGWDRLLEWMRRPPTEHPGYFLLMAGTTGLVLFDFGYFREQMCTIACPYARLQSVLMDADSMIVSYDPERGEPRGRGKSREGLGDCVDCLACVRTCPTGIDIRDGLQMECVACTQCIDACDDIMFKVSRPPGLIRYTSERELDGLPTRRLRPRTVLYGLLVTVVASALTLAVASRETFEVNVGRSVGVPYLELPNGDVANRLRFRVRNLTSRAATVRIEATAPAGATLRVLGTTPVPLAPQEMKRIETLVVVPRSAFAGTAQLPASFRLTLSHGASVDVPFALIGPGGGAGGEQ
jgi:cytochrome c oxidase accessory protein FixG